MKLYFFFVLISIFSWTVSLGQNSSLSTEQKKSIQQLINVFKSNNKTKIAGSVSYPLRREYPLKDVKNKRELIVRFDEVFDKTIMNLISKSKINDWTEIGWRGIMLNSGDIWIDDDGIIQVINYQSANEKRLLVEAIRRDKNQLPKRLQNFAKPIYLITTKSYKIRIDQKSEGVYRYAAWNISDPKIDPDIIIENGVIKMDGSGGNHTITFKNNGFVYSISINRMGTPDIADATLEVLKQEKTILTEDGDIIRN
jgi:hypothetical protein